MKTLLILLLTAAVSLAEPGSFGFTTGQKALSTTAAEVTPVSGNGRQRAVIIRNHDAAISIYVGVAGVTSSTGILLKAGESITINTRGAVFAVSASGTPTAGFLVESD